MYYQVQSPFTGAGNPLENFHLIPRVDILESTGEVVYIFEMPGIEEQSVHVEVRDGMLSVGGEIVLGLEKETLNIVYQERENIRRYNRFVSLPLEANSEQAAANVKNGLLTIRFPKKIGRRLPVNNQPQQQQQHQQQQQQQQQQFAEQLAVQNSYNQNAPSGQTPNLSQNIPFQTQNMPPQTQGLPLSPAQGISSQTQSVPFQGVQQK